MLEKRRPYSEIHTKNFRTPDRPPEMKHIDILREDDEGGYVYQGYNRENFSRYIEEMQGLEGRRAFEAVCEFAEVVAHHGGRALLVGGSVRDEVLGKASKDFDIEVYGLAPEMIENLAEGFGRVDAVGKAFGVLKVSSEEGIDLDISLPRTDSKVGDGHRGFIAEADPNMSIKEAATRRDFTFNALAKDPLTGEIFDYFGGVKDLEKRMLRVTDDDRFQDDPLRLLRGAQFVGRFGMRVDEHSFELMRSMVDQLIELPKERIKEEWDKLLMRAHHPSMGLQMLFDLGVIEKYYPELYALKATPQEFEWHPEGDVWVHTLMVTDAAAHVIETYGLTGDMARTVVYGGLCHDLGKPETTQEENGRIKAKAHEPKGEEPTRVLLERLGQPKRIVGAVIAVVKNHLWPSVSYMSEQKGESVSDGAVRRLARRIAPATIEELTYVSEADHIGRGPFEDTEVENQFLLPDPYMAGAWLRDRAEKLGVNREPPKSLIMGRDLIELGFVPGADFGVMQRLADQLRDEKNMSRNEVLEHLTNVQTSQDGIVTLERLLAQ